MSTAANPMFQWKGKMEIIEDSPDCFEFTLEGRRFIGCNESIDALCRSVKDETITLVCGIAEEIWRCVRCGPFGAPYRFGVTTEAVTKDRQAATDLAAFAASEGHVFIDSMTPIAPNTFEIQLGS